MVFWSILWCFDSNLWCNGPFFKGFSLNYGFLAIIMVFSVACIIMAYSNFNLP